MLQRSLRTSCNEGNLVADFAADSGTAAAVAENLGRKWIVGQLNGGVPREAPRHDCFRLVVPISTYIGTGIRLFDFSRRL